MTHGGAARVASDRKWTVVTALVTGLFAFVGWLLGFLDAADGMRWETTPEQSELVVVLAATLTLICALATARWLSYRAADAHSGCLLQEVAHIAAEVERLTTDVHALKKQRDYYNGFADGFRVAEDQPLPDSVVPIQTRRHD
jgi:hypothetical protein